MGWHRSAVEEAETQFQEHLGGKLQEQAESLKRELQTKLNEQAIAARQESIAVQQQRMQEIDELRLQVNALDQVFTWNSDYQKMSHQVR